MVQSKLGHLYPTLLSEEVSSFQPEMALGARFKRPRLASNHLASLPKMF